RTPPSRTPSSSSARRTRTRAPPVPSSFAFSARARLRFGAARWAFSSCDITKETFHVPQVLRSGSFVDPDVGQRGQSAASLRAPERRRAGERHLAACAGLVGFHAPIPRVRQAHRRAGVGARHREQPSIWRERIRRGYAVPRAAPIRRRSRAPLPLLV